MSEPIPESIPTSISNRSHRPAKKLALTPSSKQSAQVDALFANPEQADRLIAVGPKLKTVQAPPEIVANVQGSSAGAGSGEFHVYKASRRREYDRLRAMEEENKFEEAEKEHQTRREEWERKDQEKLSKNRAKREKARARQQKRKLGNPDTMEATVEVNDSTPVIESVKKKLGPAKALPHASENTIQDLTRDSTQAHDEAEVAEAGLTIHDDD